MCPISFAFKRMHLSALRLYRDQIVERIAGNLTPARLDILRIVYEHEDVGAEGVAQTRIQELLDLHPSVISRMLKRLRELGYVEIWANPDDLRCNLVGLTERAQSALALYFGEMGVTMEVETLMDIAFFGKTDGDGALKELRRQNYRLLNQLRIALRDRAPFLHPWTTKDATRVYNHFNPRHPFQQEHWSSLIRDDVDDEIMGLSRILSSTSRGRPVNVV